MLAPVTCRWIFQIWIDIVVVSRLSIQISRSHASVNLSLSATHNWLLHKHVIKKITGLVHAARVSTPGHLRDYKLG